MNFSLIAVALVAIAASVVAQPNSPPPNHCHPHPLPAVLGPSTPCSASSSFPSSPRSSAAESANQCSPAAYAAQQSHGHSHQANPHRGDPPPIPQEGYTLPEGWSLRRGHEVVAKTCLLTMQLHARRDTHKTLHNRIPKTTRRMPTEFDLAQDGFRLHSAAATGQSPVWEKHRVEAAVLHAWKACEKARLALQNQRSWEARGLHTLRDFNN